MHNKILIGNCLMASFVTVHNVGTLFVDYKFEHHHSSFIHLVSIIMQSLQNRLFVRGFYQLWLSFVDFFVEDVRRELF